MIALILWQDVPRTALEFSAPFVECNPAKIGFPNDPKIAVTTLVADLSVGTWFAIELIHQVVRKATQFEIVEIGTVRNRYLLLFDPITR